MPIEIVWMRPNAKRVLWQQIGSFFSGAADVVAKKATAVSEDPGLAAGDAGDAAKCWMYVVMPPLGGAAAGLLFHFTSPNDFKAHFGSSAIADLVASCLMEAFATFYLTLYVALRPYHISHPLSPVALFTLVAALVFTAGPVSGGHMNPAVTVGVYTRFKFGRSQVTYFLPTGRYTHCC